ncbi:isoleucine--tRNA ligase [symbiont of Argiope bruennichi]|uniref:isoleucine--tRNA ligase n=1 Tax=symbiont of Argiope bruennichi TaxID=2810479 RepID=UPI003DA27675
MKNSLNNTLFLPKSTFDSKYKIKKETEILKFWEDIKLHQSFEENKDQKQQFFLLDGPPYANGKIHLGHFLNKALKDIILRFFRLKGYYAPFFCGWDTHGLPIEVEVQKKLKIINFSKENYQLFFDNCIDYVKEQIQLQKKDFQRIAISSSFQHNYFTFDKNYITYQLEIFLKLFQKNFLKRDLLPVFWCCKQKTALADAEVEYKIKKSDSLYFKLEIFNWKVHFDRKCYFLVWTTTPWTLIANRLLAINEKITYSLFKVKDYYIICQKNFLFAKIETFERYVKDISVEKLQKLLYIHPFFEKSQEVVLSDHVLEDEGTGVVHIAPSHGLDDYYLAKKHLIKDYHSAISNDGTMINFENNKFNLDLKNIFYLKANKLIIDTLKEQGYCEFYTEILHEYPYNWRDNSPLVYKETYQWFIDFDALKLEMLPELEKLDLRLKNMVFNRKNWCISRQRVWGVFLPIFYLNEKPLLDETIINFLINWQKNHSVYEWHLRDAKEILKENDILYQIYKDQNITKKNEIFDVWFDSGCAFYYFCQKYQLKAIDLVVEGQDQFRGWFNSSFIICFLLAKKPFANKILSHGFIVDDKKEKLSKSKGNFLSLDLLIEKYGVDTLRLAIALSNVQKNINISDSLLQNVQNNLKKIRNWLKFIHGNLSDFSKENLTILLEPEDYFVLKYLDVNILNLNVEEKFSFELLFSNIFYFFTNILSSFYFDFSKDVLYCEKKTSRRRIQIQSTLYLLLEKILQILSPVLVFTAEEMWQLFKNDNTSVFQSKFENNLKDIYQDFVDFSFWDEFFLLRDNILKEYENAKQNKLCTRIQQADLYIKLKDNKYLTLLKDQNKLKKWLLFSDVYFTEDTKNLVEYQNCYLSIKINKEKLKCNRCWNYFFKEDLTEEGICHKCIQNLA